MNGSSRAIQFVEKLYLFAQIRLRKQFIIAAIILTVIGLILLGNWQLRRLDWKLNLIERVESRAYAAPIAAPSSAYWSVINREQHEYQHVIISGQYLHQLETLIWAITEHGNGYWVLTPLQSDNSEIFLINRGFVPLNAAKPKQRLAGQTQGKVTVTGLLRITEPKGIPLRKNKPNEELWYSRDVDAIKHIRKLGNPTAPYFIDADKNNVVGGLPMGGLTKLNYRNSHLVYAITWYGLAILLSAMTLRVIWIGRVKNKHDI